MAGAALFSETRRLDDSLVDVISLIKLLASGLWNLRVDVAGFLSQAPNARSTELETRFTVGSGLRFGNCPVILAETWEHQQLRLAYFALIGIISSYESWVDEISRLFPQNEQGPIETALQLPPAQVSLWQHPQPGIDVAIQRMTAIPTNYPAAMTVFQGRARAHRNYFAPKLPQLMIAYRAFKELRNCIAHAGTVVDVNAADWCRIAAQMPPQDLGLRYRRLDLAPNTVGAPVWVSLQDVIGLATIVQRIGTAVDADIAMSLAAQRSVLARFPGTPGHPHVVAASRAAWPRHLSNVLSGLGLPTPDPGAMTEVIAMLQAEAVVRPQ